MKSKLSKKNISGSRLAAGYGLIPNELGFCGPQAKEDHKSIYTFLVNGRGEKEVRNILERFEGAFAYYELIAKKNEFEDPLDYGVVEAYWLGNSLLEKISAADIKEMIRKKFISPLLLSKSEAERRMRKIPSRAKPHHSFHVLILGTVTGRIDLNSVELKDICRVGWGRIVVIGEKIKEGRQEIEVAYKPLLKKDFRVSFDKPKTKKINWDRKIIPSLKVGDWVSFHWNSVVQILSKENIKNLEKYTKLSF